MMSSPREEEQEALEKRPDRDPASPAPLGAPPPRRSEPAASARPPSAPPPSTARASPPQEPPEFPRAPDASRDAAPAAPAPAPIADDRLADDRLADDQLHRCARALVTTVLGDDTATARHYQAALEAGVALRPLVEVARMAHLFAGFPRAIQGLRQLDAALRSRPSTNGGSVDAAARAAPPTPQPPHHLLAPHATAPTAPPTRAPALPPADAIAAGAPLHDSTDATSATAESPPLVEPPRSRSADRSRGEALFRAIYGNSSDAVLLALDAVAADYSTWVLEDAYGRVLARPGIAARQRELLAVAALAALDCPAQLKSHLRGALRLGASRAAVAHVLRALDELLPADRLARASDALDRLAP